MAPVERHHESGLGGGMCPRDREELFHLPCRDGRSTREQDWRPTTATPSRIKNMSNDRSQPREVSGLSKIEAEDLLDRLEASGYDPCQLSFVDGEGFKVRPNVALSADDPELAGNKMAQDGKALSSQSITT